MLGTTAFAAIRWSTLPALIHDHVRDSRKDDIEYNPRYVTAKNRGPTPPDRYNLVMREHPFHGVEAIRLLPVGGINLFGCSGLLAHTYMFRGGRLESNGCVVFKDYRKFLKAFKAGHVTQMIVV